MAKIKRKLKESLKENRPFLFKLYDNWKMYLLFGLPVLVIGLLIHRFFDSGSNRETVRSITFTVFVHGPEGLDDLILKNQGKVVLILNSDKREASINEKGEATFKEIPANFKAEKVKIHISHPQPYRPVFLDSLYTLNDGAAINLLVKLYNTDKIYGNVMDSKTGWGVDSVRVSIRDAATLTDQHGYYILEIPTKYQKKFQDVRFEKDGYLPIWKKDVPVHTKQGLEIILIEK